MSIQNVNPVLNSITFSGSVVEQISIQAQGIAGGLTLLLPNTLPIQGQLLAVTSVGSTNVFLGWQSPNSGTISLSQLAQEGATNGQALVWNGTAWAPGSVSSGPSLYNRTGVLASSGNNHVASGSVSLPGSGLNQVTVTLTGASVFFDTNYTVMLTRSSDGTGDTTISVLTAVISSNAAFTIKSSNSTDTSTVMWTAIGMGSAPG